jgi:hypothetical protein
MSPGGRSTLRPFSDSRFGPSRAKLGAEGLFLAGACWRREERPHSSLEIERAYEPDDSRIRSLLELVLRPDPHAVLDRDIHGASGDREATGGRDT